MKSWTETGRTIGLTVKVMLFAYVSSVVLPYIAAFVHLSYLFLLFVIVGIAMATNSEKSRSTSERVDDVVTALGPMNTALTSLQSGNFSGNVTVGGTLTVDGAAGIHSNLTVTGTSGLTGATTISGTLQVGQDATFLSAIGVHGNINGSQDCDITGSVTASGDVTAGVSLGTDGGHVYWPGGVYIDSTGASWLTANHG